MWLLLAVLAIQSDDNAARAEGWARKAKPIAACSDVADCSAKWQRAKAWVRTNSRFQIAVDKPTLFATYGAVYANVDLSFVVELRTDPAGNSTIAARAWCGNVIACKPKPRDAIAALTRELGGR